MAVSPDALKDYLAEQALLTEPLKVDPIDDQTRRAFAGLYLRRLLWELREDYAEIPFNDLMPVGFELVNPWTGLPFRVEPDTAPDLHIPMDGEATVEVVSDDRDFPLNGLLLRGKFDDNWIDMWGDVEDSEDSWLSSDAPGVIDDITSPNARYFPIIREVVEAYQVQDVMVDKVLAHLGGAAVHLDLFPEAPDEVACLSGFVALDYESKVVDGYTLRLELFELSTKAT